MIRKAESRDIDRLVALRCEMLESISGNRTTRDGQEIIKRFFTERWDFKNPVYFVYEDGVGIRGMAAVSFFPSLPSIQNPTGKCALIFDVSVTAAARCHGIGRRLLKVVIRHCAEKGIGFIHLNASEMGKGIYRSLGFEEHKACPEMRMFYHQISEF